MKSTTTNSGHQDSAEATEIRTVTMMINVPLPVQRYLTRLLNTGLYGATINEVAERLVCRSLERMNIDWDDGK